MDKVVIEIEGQCDVNWSVVINPVSVCAKMKVGRVAAYTVAEGVFKDQELVISARQNNRDRAISTVNVH